jgi:hypothetical protein
LYRFKIIVQVQNKRNEYNEMCDHEKQRESTSTNASSFFQYIPRGNVSKKTFFVIPFFHHDVVVVVVVAYMDRVVDDAMVMVDHHHTVMVECDVDTTMIDHRSTVVLVVVVVVVAAHQPSYVVVSYDVDVDVMLVDNHDVVVVEVERVRNHSLPIPDMDIHPTVGLVVGVVVARQHHHVTMTRMVVVVDTRIHVDHHENSLVDNDNNSMNFENHLMIHNYQSYYVLRRPPVMEC